MVEHIQREKENIEISEVDQKLVIKRFEEVRKNQKRLLDWDEAQKTLKA